MAVGNRRFTTRRQMHATDRIFSADACTTLQRDMNQTSGYIQCHNKELECSFYIRFVDPGILRLILSFFQDLKQLPIYSFLCILLLLFIIITFNYVNRYHFLGGVRIVYCMYSGGQNCDIFGNFHVL